MTIIARTTTLILTIALLSGCASAYYGALEAVGIPKRDVLVSRIENARDSQEAAKEQFASALEQFTETLGFDGGDLEDSYNKLNKEFERSETRADQVSERIDEVRSVAKALFKEWEKELEMISSRDLRSQSQRQLSETRLRYQALMAAMEKAESRIEPVLVTFRDHVLFLKHNLNARAIASLSGQLGEIETDVASLIRDMESAIAEASNFIDAMQDK